MSICIFPGTFNPIHNAHLKAADYALKTYGFEKIIFIPSHIPPHKKVDKNLSLHRLNMVKLAVCSHKGFEVSDIEYKDNGKSYSLNTVKKILDLYNLEPPLNFIIGTDAFAGLKSWYKWEELAKLVHFIVFPRGVEIDHDKFAEFDYEMADMEFTDISSTDIRTNECIRKTTYKVEEYIKENGLYASKCK